MKNASEKLTIESLMVSAGREKAEGQPLNVPITMASNFIYGGTHEYSRNEGTPNWESLEDIIGRAEQGKSVCFSSGMAAISAIFDQLAVGSKIVIPEDCYQGVTNLALEGVKKGFWSLDRLPVRDTEAWLKSAEYADLIWLESPSNPLLEIADLHRICAAKRNKSSILAVDNTFATHINQQPLALGANVSIQSVTKFIGGHSDLLSGIVSTNNEQLLLALRKTRALLGATPGAMETFLAVRGIRTMHLRLERAQENAMKLAQRLEQHTEIISVRYPGLASHPDHGIAKSQLGGFGTIISFETKGDAQYADAVCKRVKLIQHATSLGAVESTMERRSAIAGQDHLPPTLLRLSVGVEHVEDLWEDLNEALKTASK